MYAPLQQSPDKDKLSSLSKIAPRAAGMWISLGKPDLVFRKWIFPQTGS
jgi:hypothetical protein